MFTDGQARSADLRATTRYLAGLLSHPFQGVAPSRGYRRPGLSGLERYSVEGSPPLTPVNAPKADLEGPGSGAGTGTSQGGANTGAEP